MFNGKPWIRIICLSSRHFPLLSRMLYFPGLILLLWQTIICYTIHSKLGKLWFAVKIKLSRKLKYIGELRVESHSVVSSAICISPLEQLSLLCVCWMCSFKAIRNTSVWTVIAVVTEAAVPTHRVHTIALAGTTYQVGLLGPTNSSRPAPFILGANSPSVISFSC